MSERKLSALESRKQLLIAESEINRGLLTQEYRALTESIHDAAAPLRNAGAWFSKTVSVVSFIKDLGNQYSSKGSESKGLGLPMRLLRLGTALWVGIKGRRP